MWLTHGWIPLTSHFLAAAAVLLTVARRAGRWQWAWSPIGLLLGVGLAVAAHLYIADQGLANDPAPWGLWTWIVFTGLACAMAVPSWRDLQWWRRGLAVSAIPLCAVCASLSLNGWVGYFPTAASVWDRVTGAALPDEIDQADLAKLQRRGAKPPKGTVVRVTIPDDASGFQHRGELVYLPPSWFVATPPPKLPVLMMIGGEFGHPADWLEAGGAQQTIERFAVRHDGQEPVLVFVDYSGTFSNDTECVNGPRGNSADHLTKDVVPFMVSHFGVRPDPAGWGVVGWSSGGTCALTLAVMHPELFSAFLDIDGERGADAGAKQQTIARLFGGDAAAWGAFDPRTVITARGHYTGVAGWFAVSTNTPLVYRPPAAETALRSGDPPSDTSSEDRAVIANDLCLLASNHGIECAVVPTSGQHDWPSGGAAFAAALPWLAGKLGTPGIPQIRMPGASL